MCSITYIIVSYYFELFVVIYTSLLDNVNKSIECGFCSDLIRFSARRI